MQWCVTVPAQWGEASKAAVRTAALRAGIITKVDSPQIMIVLEPEVRRNKYQNITFYVSTNLHLSHSQACYDVCTGGFQHCSTLSMMRNHLIHAHIIVASNTKCLESSFDLPAASLKGGGICSLAIALVSVEYECTSLC